MPAPKVLVGAATRYIAGRNAMQTVYWKSRDSTPGSKMIKFSKTFQFGKNNSAPQHVKSSNYVQFG